MKLDEAWLKLPKSGLFHQIVMVVLILGLQACSLPPIGRNIYLSSTGNDSNDCFSSSTACRTYAAAMSKAGTGSTIYIGPGTFVPSGMITKFVTLQGQGMGATVLAQASTDTLPAISITDYITVTVNDLTINGNSTTPAVRVGGPHSHFVGNRLVIANGQLGIDNRSEARVEVNNVTINNTADTGVFNTGTFTANSLTIHGSGGAGIINWGVMTLNTVDVEGSDSNPGLISEEPAGILSVPSSGFTPQLTINIGVITNNNNSGIYVAGGTTTYTGGAIYNNHGEGVILLAGDLTMNNTSIFTNQNGLVATGGVFHLSQDTISSNNQVGLSIGNQVNTTMITNSTIVYNGSGVEAESGSIILSFDTIAFNSGFGINVPAGGVVVANATLIEVNSPNCSFAGHLHLDGYPSPNHLACDDTQTAGTLLLGSFDEASGTIPLLAGSPAIDQAALLGCPPVDQRNAPRPYGRLCDFGAYEFTDGEMLRYATPGTPVYTILPTSTPTPMGSTLAGVVPVTVLQNANCRKGPGALYDVVEVAMKGQSLTSDGRDAQNLWLHLQLPASTSCWVIGTSLSPGGSTDQLPILTAPPLPDTPANFTHSSVCTPKVSLTVKLSWTPSANASGYRIYRENKLLTELKANVASYTDTAGIGKSYTYTIEAFNDYGTSQQATSSVTGCP